MFTVSDLGQVWAEINVPAKDLPLVRVGERSASKPRHSMPARRHHHFRGCADRRTNPHGQGSCGLGQSQGAWRPGLFVNV